MDIQKESLQTLRAQSHQIHKRSSVLLASVLMSCSGLIAAAEFQAERYNIAHTLKYSALKTGGIITPYCAVPVSAQRIIWWLHKDLLKVKRKISSLLAFTNPRAQPLQFGNTELSHYFLATFQNPSLQFTMRTALWQYKLHP